jgi:hypothetical protein
VTSGKPSKFRVEIFIRRIQGCCPEPLTGLQ